MRHGGRKYNDQKHTTKQQQISKKTHIFQKLGGPKHNDPKAHKPQKT